MSQTLDLIPYGSKGLKQIPHTKSKQMAPFVGGKMLGNDFMQIKQYVFNEDTGGSTHICDLPYGLLYAEIMK